MKYSVAQANLIQSFKDLALAKQEFLMLGGKLQFTTKRDTLYLVLEDGGSTLSFPFVVDEEALKKFKAANPDYEYKE